MNKKMIGKIQERMNEIGAPGACVCCPIALYGHLSQRNLRLLDVEKNGICYVKGLV